MNEKFEKFVEEKNKEFCRYLTKVCSSEKKLLVKGELLEILSGIDIASKADHLEIEVFISWIY